MGGCSNFPPLLQLLLIISKDLWKKDFLTQFLRLNNKYKSPLRQTLYELSAGRSYSTIIHVAMDIPLVAAHFQCAFLTTISIAAPGIRVEPSRIFSSQVLMIIFCTASQLASVWDSGVFGVTTIVLW